MCFPLSRAIVEHPLACGSWATKFPQVAWNCSNVRGCAAHIPGTVWVLLFWMFTAHPPRNDGFNDVPALAICTWGQGVNFEIGQSGRRAKKQRSHLRVLWGIYLQRKVNQKHRRSFSWQLRQWQRDLSRNAKRNCLRERLILTHESYSGGNKRLTLQVCFWQMLLKILSWKKMGKNPGFIVLKPQWHRSTFKNKVLIIFFYYLGFLKESLHAIVFISCCEIV